MIAAGSVALLSSAAGCGGEGSETTESSSSASVPVTGTLTFTRADGTHFSVSEGEVSCGPSTTEKKRPAIFVQTANPSQEKPFFRLEAVLADVEENPVIAMPSNYIESDPQGGILFAYDPKTRNELDSTFEDSAGAIRFQSAECAPHPEVEFSVKGTLDSEFGNLAPNDVEGSFRSD